MKRILGLVVVALLLLASLAACGPKSPIDPAFVGTWASDSTTAQMSIAVEEGQVVIKAWDTDTGADFVVTPVEIVYDKITAEFYFPPNDFRTTRTYTLNDDKGLTDTYSGGAQGTILWYKLAE